MNSNTVTWEVIVQEDPDNGDLILPIPQELLDRMGWHEGDNIEWKNDSDGKWILVKTA
jgi:bifunctional DNA-binding transcriptional regulator/antitoxin component of YhaV-PrlF toxin-antitoxin module